MAFPQTRLRRLRRTAVLRDLVRETEVRPRQLVLPLFVEAGLEGSRPIGALPGVSRHGIDSAVEQAGEAAALGLGGVLLFGIPAAKDETGSEAWDDEGAVQLATRAIKAAHPTFTVATDVCLCEYTSHGHCGLVREDGSIDNDASVELLARVALSHAGAGADLVAPSDMMDGRVGAIRAELDGEGFADTAIMAYSAKHASALYAPFRDAADSTPAFGTGAATRWTRPTATRRSARRSWTSRRAPTWSWSSRRSRRWTSSGASSNRRACRSPPTRSAASTP